jgi:hypothetical protein
VGDNDNRAWIAGQVLLQPHNGRKVEVLRGMRRLEHSLVGPTCEHTLRSSRAISR